MTKQEAIKELENISWSDRGMEAIYMAIEALQQEPKCEDCKWNTWDNNCMVEYRGCRFESKNGE